MNSPVKQYSASVLSKPQSSSQSKLAVVKGKPGGKKKYSRRISNTIQEDEFEEYRTAFRIADENDNGWIDLAELETVLRGLGYQYSKDEVAEMIEEVDADDTHTLDFAEFCSLMKRKKLLSVQHLADIRKAWDYFDEDNNGRISHNEIANVLRSLGLNPTQVEIEEMLLEMDHDENGYVDFWEFATSMASRMGEYMLDAKYRIINECRAFDPYGLGIIHEKELRHILAKICPDFSKSELDAALEQAVVDENGRLIYDEWLSKMLQLIQT